jgi:hypothetical protein
MSANFGPSIIPLTVQAVLLWSDGPFKKFEKKNVFHENSVEVECKKECVDSSLYPNSKRNIILQSLGEMKFLKIVKK